VTSTAHVSLDERRRILRQQLLAQRQLIAQRLETAPFATGEYPRSKTLSFLVQRPALAAALLAGLGTMLVGTRFFRSMTTALALARIVGFAAINSQGRSTSDRNSDSIP
jgi:hypothetical protein